MESSEDDAGAAQDAARQSSARENPGEPSSGEVGDGRLLEPLTLDVAADSVGIFDRRNSPNADERADSISPTVAETHHSTEAILDMIDEFVGASDASKKAEDLENLSSPELCYASPAKTCEKDSLSGTLPADGVKSDILPSAGSEDGCGEVNANRHENDESVARDVCPVTAVGTLPVVVAPNAVPDAQEGAVNIASGTHKTAVIVPVKHKTKIVRDRNVISSSSEFVEEASADVHDFVAKSVGCERTRPDIVVNKRESGIARIPSQLLVISEPPSLADTLVDTTPVLASAGESAITPPKPESIICQRRKLIRPILNVTRKADSPVKATSTVVAVEPTPAPIRESHRKVDDTKRLLDLKVIVNDSHENFPVHISPKKVKLVRNSNLKLSEPLCSPAVVVVPEIPVPASSVHLDAASSSQLRDASRNEIVRSEKVNKSEEAVSEVPLISNAMSPPPTGLVSMNSVSALIEVPERPPSPDTTVDKTVSESLDNSNEVMEGHQCKSKVDSEDSHPAEVNSICAPMTNNVTEANKEHDASSDKSNEVLDVRKVSPLKLSRSIIDESLKYNTKLSTFTKKTKNEFNEAALNEIGSIETENVPKLTLKLPKSSEDIEQIAKVSKINIKPLRPPDSTVDGSGKVYTNAVNISDSTADEESMAKKIPNVLKLNIKPIQKPQDTTHLSKYSSSSEVSESDSSENEIPSQYKQHHLESAVPKLTIKSLSTVSKSPARNKLPVSDLTDTPSSVIPKVTIKPILQPPLEKMTIKLGKRPDSTAIENKADSSTDSPSVPKSSKRSNQRGEHSPEPAVPKLTIKIHSDHESKVSERVDSPIVPKVTIKPIIKPDDHVSVTKINIKPIKSPDELLSEEEEHKADSVPPFKMILKSKSKSSEEQSVPKLNIKNLLRTADEAVILNEREETNSLSRHAKHAGKHSSEINDSPTVPKLTIKTITVPENIDKPLEIVTTQTRSTSGLQDSGQDSPRIILKINKTTQGSTSEILTEKSHKRDSDHRSDNDSPTVLEQTVPKLTIKIPQDLNSGLSPRHDNSKDGEVDTNLNSPVGRIKLKLAKEGSHAKIINSEVNDSEEISKENVNQLPRAGLKRGLTREETLLSIKKSPDVEKSNFESKRLKLDNLLSNSNLTVTRLSKSKSQLGNLDSELPKANASISVLSLGSKEENITSEMNKVNSIHSSSTKTNSTFSNNGDSKLQNILTRLHAQKDDKLSMSSAGHFPFGSNDTSVHGDMDSNTTSTTASYDETEAINRLGTDSPVFNKVDGDIMALNEGSSSQECMIVDDLSQDPLDIGSTAKTHFVPPNLTKINSGIVNIMAQSPAGAGPALPFSSTPRKRGRPRKVAPAEGSRPPVMPTPALEERPVRTSRTPRDRPLILRTPRTRGRARGTRRGTTPVSSGRDKAVQTPAQTAHTFFMKLTNVEADGETTSIQVQPCLVELSPLECGPLAPTPVGRRRRGRGRGSRGPRRARGGRSGRGGRGGRGGRSSRIVRGLRGTEEIQLQDAVPLTEIKREGRKSKIEATLTPALQVFEEETCMIGDNGTPHRSVSLIDEESQSSVLSGVTTESSKCKRARLMDMLDEGHKEWTAADVAEYDWPPEELANGEPPQTIMIQEQVALYLGVKSFKRKYPDLKRRPLCADEKNFIRDRGLITEALCDLGVTAVDAGEVLDIMYTDYPAKYEEYRKHLREKREARPPTRPAPPAQPSTDRSKQESMERACQSAAAWNARLNRQRRTVRSAAMDLQSMTLHRPRRVPAPTPTPVPILSPTVLSHYPVALLPGQYTDFYRTYTPEELRFFPLNTVLNIMPSPRREDTSSEESDNDSDMAGSSGEDSGSETSERHFRRKSISNPKSRPRASATGGESNSAFSVASRPASPTVPAMPDVLRCKLCNGTEHSNRRYPHENFVTCATCDKKIHPSCLEMAPNVAKCVRLYAWQCADCKCCAHCQDLADDDKMLFCDLCDRGYHIYCVGLRRVPTGRWHCSHCAMCRSCTARTPSGLPGAPAAPPPAPPDQWHHHLKKGSGGNRVYSHTLCAPCARAWRAGRYCSKCERCFVGRKGAMKLVICVNCDRRFHQECVKQPGKLIDVLNYTCSDCRRGNPPKKRRDGGGRGARRSSLLRSPPDSSHLALTDSNHSSSHPLSLDSCSNSQPQPLPDHSRKPELLSDPLAEDSVALQVLSQSDREEEGQPMGADMEGESCTVSPLGITLRSEDMPDEDNEDDSRGDPLGEDLPQETPMDTECSSDKGNGVAEAFNNKDMSNADPLEADEAET